MPALRLLAAALLAVSLAACSGGGSSWLDLDFLSSNPLERVEDIGDHKIDSRPPTFLLDGQRIDAADRPEGQDLMMLKAARLAQREGFPIFDVDQRNSSPERMRIRLFTRDQAQCTQCTYYDAAATDAQLTAKLTPKEKN